MNENDIDVLVESMNEYCEETFGICLPFMKLNNIDYNLTSNDELSILLKEVDSIKMIINEIKDLNTILNYRERLFEINGQIREIIGG